MVVFVLISILSPPRGFSHLRGGGVVEDEELEELDGVVVLDELDGVVVLDELDGVVVLEELDGVVVDELVVLDELEGVVVLDVDVLVSIFGTQT